MSHMLERLRTDLAGIHGVLKAAEEGLSVKESGISTIRFSKIASLLVEAGLIQRSVSTRPYSLTDAGKSALETVREIVERRERDEQAIKALLKPR